MGISIHKTAGRNSRVVIIVWDPDEDFTQNEKMQGEFVCSFTFNMTLTAPTHQTMGRENITFLQQSHSI